MAIHRQNIMAVGVVLLLIVIWQLLVMLLNIPRFLIPPPSAVFAEIFHSSPLLSQGIVVTTYETIAGFLIACAVGIASAMLVTASKSLYGILYPILLILQLLPKTALAPLLIIYFGYGNLPTIVLTFLISFFPIFVNMSVGLLAVEPEILDVAAYLRASGLQRLMKIRLPNSLPYLLTGMKVAITLALVGAVVGEFLASQSGLGYVIIVASNNLETTLDFAALFLITVVGSLLYLGMILLERVAIPWQRVTSG